MKVLLNLLFYALLSLLSFSSFGQGYQVGERVGLFSLVNATDNTKLNLSDFASTKGVVLVFTNNTCVYSKLYETRLITLAQEFQEKNIKFLFINPNVSSDLVSSDSPTSISRIARENNYPFPTLLDNAGLVCRTYGATKTPECFVLKNIQGNFHLFYRGAIDDNPQVGEDVTNNFLHIALTGLIDNSILNVKEKRPAGCMITYK